LRLRLLRVRNFLDRNVSGVFLRYTEDEEKRMRKEC
jgi:hypothetical protein